MKSFSHATTALTIVISLCLLAAAKSLHHGSGPEVKPEDEALYSGHKVKTAAIHGFLALNTTLSPHNGIIPGISVGKNPQPLNAEEGRNTATAAMTRKGGWIGAGVAVGQTVGRSDYGILLVVIFGCIALWIVKDGCKIAYYCCSDNPDISASH